MNQINYNHTQLQNRCEEFIHNRDLMKECFPWGNSLMHCICGAVLTNKKVQTDLARLKECKEFLKEQVGTFSNFRGNLEPVAVALLAEKEDYESYMKKTIQIYEKVKKEFRGSAYTALGALVLADTISFQCWQQLC